MTITFTLTRSGTREVRTHGVRDLQEALLIAVRYAGHGYTVIVCDQETGREYRLGPDGMLQRIP